MSGSIPNAVIEAKSKKCLKPMMVQEILAR
jgi:hypothetical protein